ncbi:MAG: UDP-N-acetylmuramate dehydrogenase [Nannocystaceae bacterium]|nr:UDP-N-acetylmuramate dehydrogenase [Nannocystaceae bacterium]
MHFESDVSLADFTTLGLGGPSRRFVRVESQESLKEALTSSEARGPVLFLAGGSNLVIADAGFDGLTVHLAMRGIAERAPGEIVVDAGEPWENVVEYASSRGWAGIECLSGIPGCTGSTPIQNVGAYGQEVAQVIASVEALDLKRGESTRLTPSECGFAYRGSRFKRERGRWLVTRVHLQLRPGGKPTLTYRDLHNALEGQDPDLSAVRDAVLALRRSKSMLLDPDDPDARSVGSFFTNPILDAAATARVGARAIKAGIVAQASEVPSYAAGEGLTKFPAAWLIERSGISKGMRRGNVAVSSKHTLALVHLGGGSTAELVGLAREIQDRVREEFDIVLEPEPSLVGVAL